MSLSAINKNQVVEPSQVDNGPNAKSIDDRLSQELVFAMVGPVGSGCTTVADHIKAELQGRYGYAVPDVITISSIIRESASLVDIKIPERSG